MSGELLALDELTELTECERIIEEGYAAFLKVGLALAKVRDSRLYRATHQTFEAYCESRWGFTRTRAYELMSAANISQAVSEISDIPVAAESHAKELRGLEPETAAEVMERAAESGDLTAASIREAREEIAPKPAHVTTTTRTTEATKVEHDVDLETGEITSPGSPTPIGSAPSIADSNPAPDVEPEPGTLDPVAAAIADGKAANETDPGLLAQKAVERFKLALKTIDAAGGLDAIDRALANDTIQDDSLWLSTLETTVSAAGIWASNIRRRNLRSVK